MVMRCRSCAVRALRGSLTRPNLVGVCHSPALIPNVVKRILSVLKCIRIQARTQVCVWDPASRPGSGALSHQDRVITIQLALARKASEKKLNLKFGPGQCGPGASCKCGGHRQDGQCSAIRRVYWGSL